MSCDADECKVPDRSVEVDILNTTCQFSGYGYNYVFHRECCPRELAGDHCTNHGVVKIDGAEHPAGDEDCRKCWSGFPVPCPQEDCPGLVHAVFGDESWEDYWLYYKCDVCGATDEP